MPPSPKSRPPSKPAAAAGAAAKPLHAASWDPWNSVGAGHQRAETPVTTGWRDSRNKKLQSQFAGGSAGGERLSDTCGAGSEHWHEGLKVVIPLSVRQRKGKGVLDMLVKPGLMKDALPHTIAADRNDDDARAAGSAGTQRESDGMSERSGVTRKLVSDGDDLTGRGEGGGVDELGGNKEMEGAGKFQRRIFDGLTIYINGSTFPLVSDHKLRHLLTENGAKISMHLGRRQVTHVILGKPVGLGGAGGGLAGGKLEKEVKTMRGCGIKFVGVEWVLDSLKAGKRLPEARFSDTKTAAKGQGSVYGLYSKLGGSSNSGP